ncbi:MAG: hypothetical protein HY716_18440 [Planctomycetes bacterium]|nr:hypothetical protein [Planctomycetota bacterium]
MTLLFARRSGPAAAAFGEKLAAGRDSFPGPRAVESSLDTRTNRAFALAIGLLLVVLTLTTQYIGTPIDLLSRIVPVDLVCVAFLAVLLLRHRMAAPSWPGILYAAAVVLALIPAFTVTPGPASEVWLQFAGVLMAFGFYLAGLNLGACPTLLRWLLAGTCAAVLMETVVVVHDSFSASMWFPDPMEGRVRGTFKTNGQLGTFGFCAGGLLVTFGTTVGGPRLGAICTATAALAASFIFFSSRRTGMFCVFLWGALFAILAWRFAKRPFYKLFLGGFLSLLLLVGIFWPRIEASFVGRRVSDALSSLGSREGFILDQLHDCLRTADQWFPFGFGIGRGYRVDPRDGYEVHNGWLAVLVELGVLGLVGYAAIVAQPLLRRRWHTRSPDHALLGVLLTTFLLTSCVFMFHNTLYRDRTFLLFLGVATAISQRESDPWSAPSLFA